MKSNKTRKNKNNNNKNKNVKIKRNNNNRVSNKRKRYVMPAAQTISIPKQFNTVKTTGTSAVVRGCDLVYSIPDSLATEFQNSQVICLIPCNPAYWIGTRVAAVASGYQNYRPVQFEVMYVPQCAVTQQGNVLAGTLWNQAPTAENLQQTLKTSNGGMLTQCYSKMNSVIKLGSNLQYNLYRMGGAIDQESNPFIFLALGIATTDSQNNRIVPGYFYVRYQYIFKNPIGTGITYSNSQLISLEQKEQYLLNAVCYLCEPIRTSNGLQVPVGSRIDIEYNNNAEHPGYNYLYNGTPLDLMLLRSIWVLENQPQTITTNLNNVKQPKNIIKYNTEKTAEGVTIEVPQDSGILYETDKDYISYVNTSLWNSVWVPISEGIKYKTIENTNQNFGSISSITQDGIIRFIADKLLNELKTV